MSDTVKKVNALKNPIPELSTVSKTDGRTEKLIKFISSTYLNTPLRSFFRRRSGIASKMTLSPPFKTNKRCPFALEINVTPAC